MRCNAKKVMLIISSAISFPRRSGIVDKMRCSHCLPFVSAEPCKIPCELTLGKYCYQNAPRWRHWIPIHRSWVNHYGAPSRYALCKTKQERKRFVRILLQLLAPLTRWEFSACEIITKTNCLSAFYTVSFLARSNCSPSGKREVGIFKTTPRCPKLPRWNPFAEFSHRADAIRNQSAVLAKLNRRYR